MYVRKMFVVLLITCGFFCFAFAQESNDEASSMHKEHKAQGMKQKGMMPGMMMGMSRTMVASNDGGVFVLMGNKLQKYDKNLVLQKEAEIKMPKDAMQGMKKKCPMMEGDAKGAQMDQPGLNEPGKMSE
ncbi:MAG: hypothetical protein ABH865_02800 [Candidatus Omnitrophota bacterium]|nr:hypothetical protein [Candidatus Omnitrophota bacterium]